MEEKKPPPKQARAAEQLIRPKKADLEKQFLQLHSSSASWLSSPSPFLRFVGLAEEGRSCCHVILTNRHSKHIVFSIRRPPPSYMHVSPKLGWVAPGEKVELFFSFNGRCLRIPDDIAFYYSIYQLEVEDSMVTPLKDDEFSTTVVRKIWKTHGTRDVDHILHLASVFLKEGSCRCGRQHGNKLKQSKHPNLDAKGVLVEEEAYDPDKTEHEEMFPSAEDCA